MRTARIHVYTDSMIEQLNRCDELKEQGDLITADAISSEWDCGTFHETVFISEELFK